MRVVERAAVGRKMLGAAVLIGACVTLAHLAPVPRPAYEMVDDLVEHHLADFEGRALRVHGYVQPGTIVAIAPDVHEYVLERNGLRLRVRHAGVLSDTFHDQAEVVQDGTLVLTWRGYELDGSSMHMKCGGKYEGASAATSDRTTKFR